MRLDARDLARRYILGRVASTGWHWKNASGEEVGSIGIVGQASHLELRYSVNGTPIFERVEITRTACHFGDTRAWLHCPRCTRRVGVLYLRGGRFVCRKCGRVAYSSQSEDSIARAWRRQERLERRLGENWTRPKGMHHSTRDAIVERIINCEMVREDALANYSASHGLTDF